MLIQLHNPTIQTRRVNPAHNGISTFPAEANVHQGFHTIYLTDYSGGTVEIFTDANWSFWDAIVEQVTEYRQVHAVRALGTDHGRNAGSWVIDGNTSREYAQSLIDGYNDGDPEVMDLQPSPLSGEFAGDPTPQDIYNDAGVILREGDDEPEHLLTEYEAAYSEAFWAEVLRAAAVVAEPEWRQTACRGCGLDIEGTVGGSEWRDRGSNTRCPGDVDSHEPVAD